MGKKKQSSSLGKSIIRDRFGKKDRKPGDTFLHTADLQDGYDWGRLNLQSVTEQNNLDDFLATAELAGTEFTAEKLNVKFVSSETGCLPHAEELKTIAGLHKQHEKLLRIPRRPRWSSEMSASEVDQNERTAFLDWRRSLASLHEDERIVMTPYEKNLDFWRQLWRVIERSDIVVQIVDARNPLLFYCADLESYVKEVDKSKICMILINKADFLTLKQREVWANYFTSKGIRVAFWSAVEETARQELAAKHESVMENIEDLDIKEELVAGSGNDEEEDNSELVKTVLENDGDLEDKLETDSKTEVEETDKQNSVSDNLECLSVEVNENASVSCDNLDKISIDCEKSASCGQTSSIYRDLMKNVELENTSMIYTGPELLELFKSIHIDTKVHEGRTTVGMVGYPNVGKSSTINAILKMKKVPVSATPGRTKHFQTLYVDPTLMLCDCPGLVFPSFVTTKADLVLGGILPIDQMRDFISPTALLCQKIPRWLLERTYGICLPKPMEGEDSERSPTAYELLNTYGAMRGFMTSRGQPDGPRSARYLLKDYVNGKLLYCQPPPDIDPEDFNDFKLKLDSHEQDASSCGTSEKGELSGLGPSKIDTEFFRKEFSTVHQRTARGDKDVSQGSDTADSQTSQMNLSTKPWKKHKNRNKREKLRRVYEYLDK